MPNQISIEVSANTDKVVTEFNRTIGETKKLSREINSLGRSGVDTRTVLDSVTTKGSAEMKTFASSTQAAEMPVDELKKKLQEMAAEHLQVTRTARQGYLAQAEAARTAQAAEADRVRILEAQRQALGELAGSAKAVAGAMLESSSGFEQQRAKLTGLYRDTDAAAGMFEKFVDFASKTPFTVKGVVDAAITLKTYKQNVDELLPVAGDMAARFGRDIPDAAQALGKAMSGSADGVQILIDSFGMSREALRSHGASVSATGEISLRTAKDIEKMRAAIMTIAKEDFAGGMTLQAGTLQGKMSNLSDAFERIKATMGDAFVPQVKDATEKLTGLIDGVRTSHPALTELAGLAAAGAATTLALAAGAGAVAAGLSLAAAAFSPFNALATFTIAALIRLNQEALELEDNYKKLGKQAEDDAKATIALDKAHREWAGKGAEDLKKMGVSAKDFGLVVHGLQMQIALLREQGGKDSDPAIAKRLKEIETWRDLGAEIGKIDAAEKARNEKLEQEKKDRAESVKVSQEMAKAEVELAKSTLDGAKLTLDERKRAGTSTIADHKRVTDASLALLKLETAAKKKAVDDAEQLEKDSNQWSEARGKVHVREKKAIEAEFLVAKKRLLADEVQAEREAKDQILSDRRDRAQESLTATEDQIRLLELRRSRGQEVEADLLAAVKQRAEKQRAVEESAHAVNLRKADTPEKTAAENARHAAAEKHNEAQATLDLAAAQEAHNKHIADSINLEKDRATAAASAAQAEITALERKRAHGVNVEAELAAAIRKSNEARAQAIKFERDAALASERDENKKAAITAAAAERLKKTATDTDEALERNHESELDRQAQQQKAHQETTALQEQLAEREVQRTGELLDKGKATQAQYAAAVEKRFTLEVQSATEKAAAQRLEAEKMEDATRKQEKLRQIEMQLTLDREKAAHDRTSALEKENKALDDQKKKIEALAGFKQGGQEITEAFNGGNFGFSIDGGLAPSPSSPSSAGPSAPSVVSPSLAAAAAASSAVQGGGFAGARLAPGATPSTAGGTAAAGAPGPMTATNVYVSGTNVYLQGGPQASAAPAPIGASAATAFGSPRSDRLSMQRDLHFTPLKSYD